MTGISFDRAERVVDLGPLADYVGFHLRLAQAASFQAFAKLADGIDLQPGRFALLALISHNPGLTPTALSLASGRDKSTITPALRDLERRGLVVRRRAPEDGRSFTLTLSATGEATMRALEVHAEAHERALDRIVGPDNKAEFLRTLRRITLALG